jgi:hypothetical protein
MANGSKPSREDLAPRVLQITGLMGMIGCALFWAGTAIFAQEPFLEPVIFFGFGGLATGGQLIGAKRNLDKESG